jgi:hypothetical protein
MKKQSILKLAVLVVLFSTFTSCSYRLIDFTVISSKNVSLKIDKTQGIRVSGSSNGLLGIGVSIKDAMDKALQSAGPEYDLLIDGVVKINDYFLVGGYKVEGTAISTSKIKASLGKDGFEDWCKQHNVFDPKTAELQN